jgi:hypothetical protein
LSGAAGRVTTPGDAISDKEGEMSIEIQLRRKHLLFVAAALLAAVVAGAAYAAIPDTNGVFTACTNTVNGAVRLIDPSRSGPGPLGSCTQSERQVMWNQTGQPGVSPTVAQLSPGDSHCPAGGAAITDASGTTAYVCSGQNGVDGKSFTGSFTSQNGLFSLNVSNTGVTVSGPGAQINLDSGGNVTVTGTTLTTTANDQKAIVSHDVSEQVGHSETITVGADRTEQVGHNDTLTVGGDRTEQVDNNETVTVDGNRTETIGTNESIKVSGNRTETVEGNESVNDTGDRTEKVTGNESIHVSGNRTETVDLTDTSTVGLAMNLIAGFVSLNGSATTCRPVAGVGDQVDPSAFAILTGSPTVCVG